MSGIDYWTRRSGAGGLAPFGNAQLGELYNRGLFRAKARALASALRREALPPAWERRCLDAGVGHGWLLETWRRQGVGTIAGLDAVPEVARRAGLRVPRARVVAADLAGWRPGPGERYDLVCALDTLFYLKDEAGFEHALSALAEAVAPGGLLALSDCFPPEPLEDAISCHRPWARYRSVLGGLGLAPRRRRSFFVLANPPSREAGERQPLVYNLVWHLSRARHPLARPLEAAAVLTIYGLDALILSLGGRWGSQEIAVFQRPR